MAEPADTSTEETKETTSNQEETKENGNGSASPQELMKKMGTLEAKVGEYDDYKGRVEPVIQTIWSDPKLYESVLAAHKKRMGLEDAPETEDSEEPKETETKEETKPKEISTPQVDMETRNAVFADKVSSFESRVGLDKLEPEKRGEMNTKIGAVLGDLLDLEGTGKSVPQLLQRVPLQKLDKVLQHAYDIATKDEREQAAKSKAVSEYQEGAAGKMASPGGSSVTEDSVFLTEKEKVIAQRLGVSEDKYLERKKEILKRDGKLA